jgi:hypothetical protein
MVEVASRDGWHKIALGEHRAFAAWKTMNQNREKDTTSKCALRPEDFTGRVALGMTISLASVSPGTRATI